MVRNPAAPSVLAEMSFMGNPLELDLLRTRKFRVAEATAIANAVVRYFSTDDPGSGFTEPSFTITTSGGGGGTANCTGPDFGDEVTFEELPEPLDDAALEQDAASEQESDTDDAVDVEGDETSG